MCPPKLKYSWMSSHKNHEGQSLRLSDSCTWIPSRARRWHHFWSTAIRIKSTYRSTYLNFCFVMRLRNVWIIQSYVWLCHLTYSTELGFRCDLSKPSKISTFFMRSVVIDTAVNKPVFGTSDPFLASPISRLDKHQEAKSERLCKRLWSGPGGWIILQAHKRKEEWNVNSTGSTWPLALSLDARTVHSVIKSMGYSAFGLAKCSNLRYF